MVRTVVAHAAHRVIADALALAIAHEVDARAAVAVIDLAEQRAALLDTPAPVLIVDATSLSAAVAQAALETRFGAPVLVLGDACWSEHPRVAPADGVAAIGSALATLVGAAPAVPARDPLAGLSARQRQVLDLLLAGEPHDAIARELRVATTTVRYHVRALYRALGVHSRAEAARLVATAPRGAETSPSRPLTQP